MIRLLVLFGFSVALGVAAPQSASAQSDPCSTTGGYPAGSPGAVLAGLQNLADGGYAACVERRRAQQPVVNWTPVQIRSAGHRAVLSELRDPSSAQFRNVRRIQRDNGSTVFCGEVNARNGYGGMAGFTRFEAVVNNRGEASAQLDSPDNLAGAYFNTAWNQFCGRIAGTAIQF